MPNIRKIVANKLLKNTVLQKDTVMARHILETVKFSKANLKTMLSKYDTIVIKPTCGMRGRGLIRIDKVTLGCKSTKDKKVTLNDAEEDKNTAVENPEESKEEAENDRIKNVTIDDNLETSATSIEYKLQYRHVVRHYYSLKELLLAINNRSQKKPYVIQQGIQLKEVNGCPVDYRIRIEKSSRRWRITAVVARKARKGLFVTNLAQGGTQLKFHRAVEVSISSDKIKPLKKQMCQLSRLGARLMEKKFNGVTRLGFDYGIDEQGKIWLFEVNTSPR